MTDLIARIEAVSEGSRELSDECLLAAGFEYGAPVGPSSYGMVGWKSPIGTKYNDLDAPDPTRNLQDVLDWMVPEKEHTNKAAFLAAVLHQSCMGDISDERIPLVVCAATLRAREADAIERAAEIELLDDAKELGADGEG